MTEHQDPVALETTPAQPPRTAAFAPVAHAAPTTSSLAIASFVLSLLSIVLGPFGFIPGIVCGHIAKAQCLRTPSLEGLGFAQAGLIIGYIFLGLSILVMMFILGVLFFGFHAFWNVHQFGVSV